MMHIHTSLTCEGCSARVEWAMPVRVIHGHYLMPEIEFKDLPRDWRAAIAIARPPLFYCGTDCLGTKPPMWPTRIYGPEIRGTSLPPHSDSDHKLC